MAEASPIHWQLTCRLYPMHEMILRAALRFRHAARQNGKDLRLFVEQGIEGGCSDVEHLRKSEKQNSSAMQVWSNIQELLN